MTDRFVVIGGDAAGMTAASTARRRARADALDVVVFERTEVTSYAACGLPYLVGGLVPAASDLVARSPEQHRANGIDVRTSHDAIAIDTDAGTVTVVDRATSTERTEPYDRLLIAVGASPIRPPLPGVDAPGVFGVKTIADAVAIQEAIRGGAHRVVVVGGGYIGIEMAEAMRLLGLDVALVEQLPQPMATMDPDMGDLIADALRASGVDTHVGTAVTGFVTGTDGRVRAVATADGEIPADIVVLGLGVRPNTQLASDAGIVVGPSRAIAADARMATSAERVWTAGDCAESFHRVSRAPVSIALGTHANKQGRVVGVNATGGSIEFPGVIGTAITKLCDYEIARTGLNEREATAAGFAFESATITAPSRANYYPDAAPMTVKLVAERGSGRLLGGQIVGQEGAGKRIDVLAAAVWTEMTVDELGWLDLAYAPPFSPVWDPVLTAARRF